MLGFILATVTPASANELSEGVVASVNGAPIMRDEFETAVYSIGRSTLYHGRPTEEDRYIEFRQSVLDKIVDRKLLLSEARRRGVQADTAAIEQQLAIYEQRYGDTERWQEQGAQLKTSLRQQLEEDSILVALEAEVRNVGQPGEKTLQDFYTTHPEKFTEPGQERVSVILLGVQPSANAGVWQAARAEANSIIEQLQSGQDFAEVARLRSSDVTAADGGDMGYIHSGMLSAAAQQAIDDLSAGEISDPVTVLEGIAIFRLQDRRPARLREFNDVRERAAALWQRESSDHAWTALLTALRSGAVIEIDTAYLATAPTPRY